MKPTLSEYERHSVAQLTQWVLGGLFRHNVLRVIDASGGDPLGTRLSDQDRERLVEVLKTSCSDGRLTLDEFSERVDAAYQAVALRDVASGAC